MEHDLGYSGTYPPPKKSLGQHFLTSPSIANAIAEAACGDTGLPAFEIGPGRGILTEALLAKAPRVVAVEKDPALVQLLREQFARAIAQGTFTLIEGDALTETPERLGFRTHSFVLAANIPYYATGEILRSYLASPVKPYQAALLVQKEVAQRAAAKDGKESLLSLSIKAYGVPAYVKTVKAGAFNPPPKVDSAILRIEHIRTHSGWDERAFFAVARAAFGKKRKQIGSTLGEAFGKERAYAALATTGIEKTARPEDVPFSAWEALAQALRSES